jgi:probable rRNA maturation factor
MAIARIHWQNDIPQNPVDEERLRQIADAVLTQEGQTTAEMTLVLTDDATIQELNRTFRQVDSPTDVLAFPTAEGADFVLPPDLPPYLGDVIISYPTALAQAEAQGHPVDQELTLLIVHGCLHLLGYDHETEEERQRMWARQEALCAQLAAKEDDLPPDAHHPA